LPSDLRLSLACNAYDRTAALIDGRVRAEGIALDLHVLKPRQLFPRALDNREFDVCELSLGSYASLVARGKSPFVAIPVMLSKIFRHSCIYVRDGIAGPEDLKGKRVGTTQYGATAIVTIKGMLADEYGVMPRDMSWFVGGLRTPTETPLIALNLPKDITLEFLDPGETLERMFAEGRLDALFSIYIPEAFRAGARGIRRLFAEFRSVEAAYYRRTGIFPIMHIVAIRRAVHDAHPWVAQSLYRAFTTARDLAIERLYDTDALTATLPFLIDHVEEARALFGADYWGYGVDANRPALAALCRWIFEQGLAPRLVGPDELFVKVA
jgi:4,5-dihydroxyphthalate decarboxylase